MFYFLHINILMNSKIRILQRFQVRHRCYSEVWVCEILSVQSRKNLGAPDVKLSPISGDFALSPADLKREGHSGDNPNITPIEPQ